MPIKILHLNDLASFCGYFESETGINNGYGCTHPENEIQEEYEDGKKMGKCYSFSCPIASEADLEDLKTHDKGLYEIWKDEGYDPSDCGGNLMLYDEPEEKE
jgi:hypothetical protein